MSGRWPRQILFGDIDAMFASAAVLADPSLRGKPVAVGGPPPRGIVAAASYEVRRFGVRSAMPTIQAMRLCPQLILVRPDRPLYARLHRQLQDITDRFFPETEWTSVDEFYTDTTRLQTRHPDPRELGQALKTDITRVTGLTCTVALASGKTVAKIAADAHKPDGLAVIEPGTESVFLAPLPVRSLPGIGPNPPKPSSVWAFIASATCSSLDSNNLSSVYLARGWRRSNPSRAAMIPIRWWPIARPRV